MTIKKHLAVIATAATALAAAAPAAQAASTGSGSPQKFCVAQTDPIGDQFDAQHPGAQRAPDQNGKPAFILLPDEPVNSSGVNCVLV